MSREFDIPKSHVIVAGTEYRLLGSAFAAGGQASLYEAVAQNSDVSRRFLIKRFHDSGDYSEEFASEELSQIAAANVHQAILAAAFYDKNQHTSVMLKASSDCSTVQDILNAWEDMPPEDPASDYFDMGRFLESIQIVKSLLGALSGIHKHGVLHMDISPSNVMWGRTEAHGTAYMLDFSCCAKKGSIVGERRRTTRSFSAPEAQIPGTVLTPAADIYSVGAVFLLLVAGMAAASNNRSEKKWSIRRLPGEGNTNVTDRVDDLEIPDAYKGKLSEIIIKATTSVDKRYQSASEMLEDMVELERIIAGRGMAPETLIRGSAALFRRECDNENGIFHYELQDDLVTEAVDFDSKTPIDILTQNTILLGSGGSGKTTKIRKLWKMCLADWKNDRKNNPVPIFVPLNTFDSSKDGKDFIKFYIATQYFRELSKDDGTRYADLMGMLRSRGRYVLFLDGINEAVGNDKLNAEIADFAAIENVAVLITSRNDWGDDKTKKWFSTAELMPLDDDLIIKKLRDKALGTPSARLLETLRRPMFLTMYLKLKITDQQVETPGQILREHHKYLIDAYKTGHHGEDWDLVFEFVLNDILPKLATDIKKMAFETNDARDSIGFIVEKLKIINDTKYKTNDVQNFLEKEIIEVGKAAITLLINCGILRKTNGSKLTFAHQNYFEFYQAFSVVRQLMKDPEKSTLPLYLSSDMLISEVIVFLCELWKPVCSECNYSFSLEETIKQWLHKRLAGKQGCAAQTAVQNLIEILKRENNHQLQNFSFDGLDLRTTNFYQCNISGSTFKNALVSESAFISPGHRHKIEFLEIAPQNQRIVTGTRNESKVIVWDIGKGKPLYDIDVQKPVVRIAISSDEHLLAVCCGPTDSCWIKLYSLEDGSPAGTIKSSYFPLHMFFFIKGQHSLLLDNMGHGIARCDILPDEILIKMVPFGDNWFDYATHSPNGEFFLISFASRENKKRIVTIFSIDGHVATFTYHDDTPIHFLFSPDGKLVLGTTEVQYRVLPKLYRIDLLSKKYSVDTVSICSPINAVSERYLFSANECYDLEKDTETYSVFGYDVSTFRDAYISYDGSLVAIVENGTAVFIYDHDTSNLQKHFSVSTHGHKPYQIHPEVLCVNENLIMRIDPRGRVASLDTQKQIATQLFEIQNPWEYLVCEEREYVLKDNKAAHTIDLWHIAENRCVASVSGSLFGVVYASYQSNAGKLIITEDAWDAEQKDRCLSRVKIYTIPEHPNLHGSIIFPDFVYHHDKNTSPILEYTVAKGKIILGTLGGDIQIIQTNGENKVYVNIHSAPIAYISATLSHEYFVTCSLDGQLIVWHSETLQHWTVENAKVDLSKMVGIFIYSPTPQTKWDNETLIRKEISFPEGKIYWLETNGCECTECDCSIGDGVIAMWDTTLSALQLDNGALLFESTQDTQGARIRSFSLSPNGEKLAIITEIGKTEVHKLGRKEVLTWDILDVEDVRSCDFSGAKLFGNQNFAEQLLINGAIVDS